MAELEMIPRPRIVPFGGDAYTCRVLSGPVYGIGVGATPIEAYDDWKRQHTAGLKLILQAHANRAVKR